MPDHQDPVITDPVHDPNRELGWIDRVFAPLVRDQRDLPFVRLALWQTLVFVPLAAWLFWPGSFRWWMAPIYGAAYMWYLGPYILMLHNTTHRVLYKSAPLNLHITWIVGPLLGMSPGTYAAHHMGMHHADGNLPDDLSSTMCHQRDSFLDFLKYYFAFLFGHYQISKYFVRHRRRKMLRRFWTGEIVFFSLTAVALAYDWRPAVVVFVFPVLFSRFMMMTGNWAQHAFVDPDDPTNDYRTVTTFINAPYNHRCFNDGYHLGHHLKASRHWLDMPNDFLAKRDAMIRQQTLVFRQLDYFMIFVLLMLKRHRKLASYAVSLDPENPWKQEELIALLHRRLKKFPAAQRDALRRRKDKAFADNLGADAAAQ